LIGSGGARCARGAAPAAAGVELAPAADASTPPPSPDGSVTEIGRPAVAPVMPSATALEPAAVPELVEAGSPSWRVVASAVTRWLE
jgi:hypothetical protein